MYVLAIDPGNLTGVALVTEQDVVWAQTLPIPKHAIDLLSTIKHYYKTPCVCEEAPSLHAHEQHVYGQVLEIVRGHPNVTFLTPSQWKGHPSTRLSASDKAVCRTKHEREAAGLGRRFLAMRRSNERQNAVPAGGNP